MSIQEKYLDLLKSSLANEIYIENEARFLYIFSMLTLGQKVEEKIVRDIGKELPEWVKHLQEARQNGNIWWKMTFNGPNGPTPLNLRNVCEFSHTMIGRRRLDNITECLDLIRQENISGDLAETGVWRGGATILMRGYLEAWNIKDRKVWVADSFEGMPVPSAPEDHGYDFSSTKVPILAISLEEVQENFRRYELLDDQVQFLKGWFSDTLRTAPIDRLALLRLDGDLYESTMDSLLALYDKVSSGGFIIVDDFNDFEPCRRAITEFRQQRGIIDPLVKIDWTGVYWRKS